jgi:putative DNA primase/helicase
MVIMMRQNHTCYEKKCETYESIPAELKKFDQWVYWQRVIQHGKPTKRPYDANTRDDASTTNPTTWANFDQAYRVLTRCKGIDGLGFVFSTNDPFIGLDWDHIRDPVTGIIDEKILSEEIIPLGSYAEVSPSGTGVHVIGIGSVPGDRNKVGDREMYHTGRFFTMTGMHIEGTPLTVEKVSQEALDLVYKRMVGDRAPQKTVASAPRTGNISLPSGSSITLSEMSDEDIISKCLLAKNGDKFRGLFERGDISGYKSQSEADMALCGVLIFYTHDATQIDRIFRQSHLYRPRWDEKRGVSTWGANTILKALNGSQTRESYHTKSVARPGWRIKDRRTFVKGMGVDIWQM